MNRVCSERKMMGLTQEQLASELNVAPSTVVRWERGGNIPNEKLKRMRCLFKCDLDWLLGLSDSRQTII